jgi:hypothetical protein
MVCYCRDAQRCHRTLAASFLAKVGANYRGEMGDPCPATSTDPGTGLALHCAMSVHANGLPHVADGMQWRDGEVPEVPVAFGGGRR